MRELRCRTGDAIARIKTGGCDGLSVYIFVPINRKTVQGHTDQVRGTVLVIDQRRNAFGQPVIVVTVACVDRCRMAIALVNETCCDGLPFTAPEGVECIVIERRSAMPSISAAPYKTEPEISTPMEPALTAVGVCALVGHMLNCIGACAPRS